MKRTSHHLWTSLSGRHFQQIQSLNLNATISADFSQKSATYKCSQDDEDSLVVYESIPKYARYHLDEATNEPGYFKPINFLDIVRKNWSVLESETSTYEALISLVKLMSDYITGSELYLIFFEHLLEEKIATHHNATTFSDEEIKDIFC